MNRVLKQILFTLFYLSIASLIIFGIYQIFVKPAPTCDDGILNQNEEQVDCGGPCTSCAIKNLRPVSLLGNTQVFPATNNRSTIFSEIINPNETHGAKIDYVLRTFNNVGTVSDEIFNTSLIFPSDSVYIHEVVPDTVSKTEIEILETQWISKEDLPISNPRLVNFSTRFEGLEIIVEGVVKNTGVNPVQNIKIISLFMDELGFNNLLSSQTIINDLGSLDEKSFKIIAPVTENLEERIDLNETKVFLTVND